VTPTRLVVLGAVLAAAACVERMTAPGDCPAFCPGNRLSVIDSMLAGSISRDSAYRGYVLPHQTPVMLVTQSVPGLPDSRAIFSFSAYGPRMVITSGDTATGAIRSADSARLQLYITRRDTAAHNLTLSLYRLPITLDTLTTFADLSGPFTDSLLRSVNISALLALPGRHDSATGDTIKVDSLTRDSLAVDTLNHRLIVWLRLDSSQVRYDSADTGKVAYGIRVSADSLASIALGKGDLGPTLLPYVSIDSGDTVVPRTGPIRGTPLATFVFVPPPAPLDSTLAVGGVPAARSILRVAFPRGIRDSGQIIRGTLILVPAVAAAGAPADSFVVEAHTVFADFGAKSPIVVDATRIDTTVIRVGATDSVKIEITNLLRFWQSDTTQRTVLVLKAKYEARDFSEIRFYPSTAPAYRPAIRVTYAPRFPFGR
jgi:hypothetical protein